MSGGGNAFGSQGLGGAGLGAAADEAGEAGEGDVFLDSRRLEDEQDNHLDAIGATLQRVGNMAESFGNELRSQNE